MQIALFVFIGCSAAAVAWNFARSTAEFLRVMRALEARHEAQFEELKQGAEADRFRVLALRQALLRHELREEAREGEGLPGLPR